MTQQGHQITIEDYAGCFGDFCSEDKVCRKFCALSILCAIERELTDQMELMEEIVIPENIFIRPQ
ncbi:MAG: hypothetical protein V2I97_10170 [Desulfococcaceae bacterium]|nr:hypothetical protein [Desulfococcaceae bacterium]